MKNALKRKLVFLLLLVAVIATSSLTVMSSAQQQAPLFSMTLIAPGNANLVRRQWGQIIANALQQAGIDAKIVYLGWGPVFDRAVIPSRQNVGKTYADGGFDAVFIGQTPGLIPNPLAAGYYGGDPAYFAPDGLNFELYNNATGNSVLEQYVTSSSDSQRQSLMKQWQAIVFDDLPESEILYEQFVIAANPALSGYGWTYFNVGPTPQWLKGKTSVTYASTGELLTFLPPLSQSWYDAIAFQPMYDQMAIWTNDYPNRIRVPSVLQNWTSSDQGRVWTLKVRNGINWHDGVPLNADDILWTFYMNINPEGGSAQVGITSGAIGTKVNFKWLNGTTTVFQLPGATEVREGTIEAVDALTVKVTLPVFKLGKPYLLFDPELLTSNANPATGTVQPKHVYEQFPPSQWANLPCATPGTPNVQYKVGGVTKTLSGPIGCGPYKFASWDSVTQVLHLTKNGDYWNKTALENAKLFGVQDYYVKYIPGKESALAALKNGEVDLLDGNYLIHREKGTIDPSWGKVIMMGDGRQYLAYNMKHPILGTGTATPLGKQDPTKAAFAARCVRKAIDYLIPRDLIIQNLLAGDALPGTTHMLPDQAFYDSSIKARPYDLQQALRYLALAGYNVPSNPVPIAPSISSFIVGMSTHITGVFSNPVTGEKYDGMVAVIQETKDNATWKNVATGETDSQGKFDVVITPSDKGAYWYRAYFPGATAADAAFAGAAGANFDYSALPTVLPPVYSLQYTKVSVSTLQDTLQSLATKDQVTSAQNSITSLQAQVSQLTGVAYGAIAVAVVLGLIAIVLAMRKKS